MRYSLAVCAVFLAILPIGFSATIVVPDDYLDIQLAIDASINGDLIVVKPGTYLENINFSGKAVTVKSEQGPALTIIDGNQLGCVVTFNTAEMDDSVLSGFTITNGLSNQGGGVYCKTAYPIIENNVITQNEGLAFGGGIYCSTTSPATIRNNLITGNLSGSLGGGIYLSYSEAIVTTNLITNNKSKYGGGVRLWHSDASLMNNTFTKNEAETKGGAIYSANSKPVIVNAIVWDNISPENPEIYYSGGDPNVSYSDVAGGFAGDFNIDSDPLFNDPANDDFHLTWLSQCINRGVNDGAPAYDFDGIPLPYMGTVEMGVYEFTGEHSFEADIFSVSEVSGGTIKFLLKGEALRDYMILGGLSGSIPGIPLPGGEKTLPINWDIFTAAMLDLIHTPYFTDFFGALDSNGQGSAALFFPTLPGATGVVISLAFALRKPLDFASNPINIEITP